LSEFGFIGIGDLLDFANQLYFIEITDILFFI